MSTREACTCGWLLPENALVVIPSELLRSRNRANQRMRATIAACAVSVVCPTCQKAWGLGTDGWEPMP